MIMKCGSKKSGSTLGRLEFGALGEDTAVGQTYVNVNERRSGSASDGSLKTRTASMAASVVAPVLEALEHLSKLGLPGQIGYVLALSAWTALCLPTTPIELTAGFCFSKHVAMITSASGKTLGNVLALFLGRTFLQPLILRQLDSRPSWRRYHKHLLRELHELPIQTMSTLRAAPMPTPFKLYALSIFPPELVTMRRYLLIAVFFNTMWSGVWVLAGSSAGSIANIIAGKASEDSTANLVSKVVMAICLFGCFSMFSRFASAQLKPGPAE